VLTCRSLTKTYRTRNGQVKALDDVTLHIDSGQFVALSGASGSGKTTLLMAIAAMLQPSAGTVQFDGKDLYAMTGSKRARFRAQNIGFVFQMFHLVPYLNVLENVLVAGGAGTRDVSRAHDLLKELGLQHRVHHRPAALSAGERQRAAIARALLNKPRLILADEPTGNLDPENARSVLTHLRGFQSRGGTVIMATHGLAAKDFADRTVSLRDGKCLADNEGCQV